MAVEFFLAGVAVGTLIGVGITCILTVAGRADEALEKCESASGGHSKAASGLEAGEVSIIHRPDMTCQ